MIYNDKYLIVTSLILAIIVWVVTSISIGDDETRHVKVEMPLTLSSKVAEQLGMQFYTIRDSIEVDVTVVGKKYVIGQVAADDINVKFDISKVTRAGEQSVPIIVTASSGDLDFSIDSYYPTTIDAYFDVVSQKTLDLRLEYDEDMVADGYAFGEPVISEDKILVSGPKTYVDSIDRAMLYVETEDDKKLTEPYTTNCNITLESDSGTIEENYISIYSNSNQKTPLTTVGVTLPVVKISEVPVEVSIEGVPKGISQSDIGKENSVDTLEVGFLDSAKVNKLNIGSVNFNKLRPGSNKFKFKTSEIKGISAVYSNVKEIEAVITLDESDYSSKEISIDVSDIKLSGLAEGKTASVTGISSRTVTVYYPADIDSEEISIEAVKCDLSEESGNGMYQLSFKLSDSSAWVYGEYTADVVIE